MNVKQINSVIFSKPKCFRVFSRLKPINNVNDSEFQREILNAIQNEQDLHDNLLASR